MTGNTPANKGITVAQANEAMKKAVKKLASVSANRDVHADCSAARLDQIIDMQNEINQLKARLKHRVSFYADAIGNLHGELSTSKMETIDALAEVAVLQEENKSLEAENKNT